MKKRIFLFLSFFLVSVMAEAVGATECEDPEQLTFSIIPTEETIQELAIYKPVIDYLSKQTGKKIEFYMPTSYSTVVEAMVNKWVDVAVLGPYSYVIAHKKDPNIVVFATYAKRPGHIVEEGPAYKAVLITQKDSGLTTIASLKGKTVALTDPDSTSGSLLPRGVFSEDVLNGAPLESHFRKVVYSGGHDLSIMSVYEGKADAAFVATHRFDNVIDRGMVKKEDFNYIWWSATVPQDPFAYRMSLCPELREKIRQTFLTLHQVPETKPWLDNLKSKEFVPMTDADYDVIRIWRKVKQNAKK
ncbi:MAG: phosphate/phosphite/phosphonate ABC transporter substrate-binding protein [Desulfobacteraceae bacterium]|nr:MAG: phosphate/phosphite/phosphonate ABC transporter substrate-binding protein [Desulfobacteraceae bacterium]